MSDRVRVLFVSANPTGTSVLELGKELREIAGNVRAAEYRDALELIPVTAARPRDVIDALLRHRPQVVHFSGHGSPGRGLYLNDDDDRPTPVNQVSLVGLVSVLKDELRVVVLNACHSHELGRAVVAVLECAIGMEAAIRDEDAIRFAATFYQALAYGRSVRVAFELGKVAIGLSASAGDNRNMRPPTEDGATPADEHIPQLFCRGDVDPGRLVLVRRPFVPRKLIPWAVLALVCTGAAGGIALLRRGPAPSPFSRETDPVEMVAGRFIEAYNQPLIGAVAPRVESPDFPYYKLRQATFRTARVWKGDGNKLFGAIDRLEKKRAFAGRDAESIGDARERLRGELDSVMRMRYAWLHDEVMPALKASGEAVEVELPPKARVSFGDAPGSGPKESFGRLAEVQAEIEALRAYVE
jgi:hypothetical protein